MIVSKIKKLAAQPAMRRAPLSTIARLTQLGLLYGTRRSTQFSFQFGNIPVRFNFHPLGMSFGSNGIFVLRNHYEDLLTFGHRFLRYDSVALDCGANQGIFACAFGRYLEGRGRVFALEPLPYAAALLQSNIALNALENVTVVNAAVSDKSGEALMDLSQGAVSASIVHDFGAQSVQSVKTISLDDLARSQGLERADFIKLDVEGAELAAIRGARQIISHSRPIVCVEAHDEKAFSDIIRELSGYQPFVFDESGRLLQFHTFYPKANVFLLPDQPPR